MPGPACPTATVRTPRRSKPRSNSVGGVKKGVREPKELALTTKPSGCNLAQLAYRVSSRSRERANTGQAPLSSRSHVVYSLLRASAGSSRAER